MLGTWQRQALTGMASSLLRTAASFPSDVAVPRAVLRDLGGHLEVLKVVWSPSSRCEVERQAAEHDRAAARTPGLGLALGAVVLRRFG